MVALLAGPSCALITLVHVAKWHTASRTSLPELGITTLDVIPVLVCTSHTVDWSLTPIKAYVSPHIHVILGAQSVEARKSPSLPAIAMAAEAGTAAEAEAERQREGRWVLLSPAGFYLFIGPIIYWRYLAIA